MPARVGRDYRRISPAKAIHRYIALLLFEGRPITSRARWLNFLTFGLYSLLDWLPQLKAAENPVFIVGMGRSGTTFLGEVLSLHPTFGFFNEAKALWYKVHPDDDVIGNYSRQEGKYVLTETDFTEAKALKARKFYGAYLRLTGAKRILDKYPEMIFRTDFVLSLFPKAKFVFLVRNGIDTCHSISEWNRKNAHGNDNWWGRDNRKWELMKKELLTEDPELLPFIDKPLNDPERAALEWLITIRKGLELNQKHPDSVLIVKYEDLVVSGKETIASILSFCGLKSTPRIEHYLEKTLTLPNERKNLKLEINKELLALIRQREIGYGLHEDSL